MQSTEEKPTFKLPALFSQTPGKASDLTPGKASDQAPNSSAQ